MLENYESLDVKGGFIRVNGEIALFSFGEVLNEESAFIYIEKVCIDIVGVY